MISDQIDTMSASRNGTPNKKPSSSQSTPTSSQNANKSSMSAEFQCKLKYMNRLPDIPFDPKLLAYPFDPQRFFKYTANSLDRTYKWTMHNEPSLALPIHLIDPSYQKMTTTLREEITDANDKALMQPLDMVEEAAGGAPKISKTKKKDMPAVFWAQKTRYMAGHYDGPNIKNSNAETT